MNHLICLASVVCIFLPSVLQVDQAAFALDKKTFRLEPRKSTTITVSLKTEARATGKFMQSPVAGDILTASASPL